MRNAAASAARHQNDYQSGGNFGAKPTLPIPQEPPTHSDSKFSSGVYLHLELMTLLVSNNHLIRLALHKVELSYEVCSNRIRLAQWLFAHILHTCCTVCTLYTPFYICVYFVYSCSHLTFKYLHSACTFTFLHMLLGLCFQCFCCFWDVYTLFTPSLHLG